MPNIQMLSKMCIEFFSDRVGEKWKFMQKLIPISFAIEFIFFLFEWIFISLFLSEKIQLVSVHEICIYMVYGQCLKVFFTIAQYSQLFICGCVLLKSISTSIYWYLYRVQIYDAMAVGSTWLVDYLVVSLTVRLTKALNDYDIKKIYRSQETLYKLVSCINKLVWKFEWIFWSLSRPFLFSHTFTFSFFSQFHSLAHSFSVCIRNNNLSILL